MQIPSRLVDISDFRPVPDHQETFADGNTDQSVVIEVMVRLNSSCTRYATLCNLET